MMQIFTGRCSWEIVANSCRVIWKPPSPQMPHTVEFGRAT